MDDDDVPFGLIDPVEQTPRAGAADEGLSVTIYLVDDEGMLVPVSRSVSHLQDRLLIEELTTEPATVEEEQGLRTLLAGDGDRPPVRGVDRDRGVATIDLGEAFADLDGADQVLALAQLVLTFTSRPGVGQVAFTLDGAPVEVPRADGTLTGDLVTRGDFSTLLAA